jgi:hypothetical protein
MNDFLKRTLPEPLLTIARRLRQTASFGRGLAWGLGRQEFAGPESRSAVPPPRCRLEDFFDARVDGRGIWKWQHYFEVYERHLSKFVGRESTMLEIGIYSGGSLEMWRDYFGPQCQIVGVDIEPSTKLYEDKSTRVLIGDQSDRDFWRRFREEIRSLDIVIDDGGHAPHQQRATMEELLPHLRPGGVFICEDIHGVHNEFGAYVAGMIQNLNAMSVEPHPGGFERGINSPTTPFQRVIHSIHVYPYLVVVEKHTERVESLYSERHGTSWQPFGLEPKGMGTHTVVHPA